MGEQMDAEVRRLMERAQTTEQDKLARAMAVVTDALAYQDEGHCYFCSRGTETHVVSWHAADCPLVTNGFIDREGKRP